MQALRERLEEVRRRIGEAAERCGRTAEDVELVAVTKTHAPEVVEEARACGQLVFGENRVQELLAKAAACSSHIRWHLIGHLQSNKIRKVLPVCEWIHGVDSTGLAAAMDRVAAEMGLFPRVLLEVNVAGEASKFGFSPEALERELPAILRMPRLQVGGLMTVAPAVAEPEDARPVFRALRELRDRLCSDNATPLPALSMGMTHDFEVAIEEGATMVRVGSALFGSRAGGATGGVAGPQG